MITHPCNYCNYGNQSSLFPFQCRVDGASWNKPQSIWLIGGPSQYSQPSVIRNSFIRKPWYPDRIFRNGTLTMGNTLVFTQNHAYTIITIFKYPEIRYPEEISTVPKVPDNQGLTVLIFIIVSWWSNKEEPDNHRFCIGFYHVYSNWDVPSGHNFIGVAISLFTWFHSDLSLFHHWLMSYMDW